MGLGNRLNLSLSGKRAIVCGSTNGIGKATADKLAERGAEIILIARDPKKLEKTLHDLPDENNQTHITVCADFNSPDELKNRVSRLSDPVHILVNNSGGPPGGALIEAKEEEFRLAFERHLICNQIMVKAVVNGMKELGSGRIINIISTSVKQVIPGLGVSNTTRGAVANWARTLALELGQFGITVNNILPGYTDTERLHEIFERKSKLSGTDIESIIIEAQTQIPLKRFATPSETAKAICFLASPDAAYINGVNLPVDGGRLETL